MSQSFGKSVPRANGQSCQLIDQTAMTKDGVFTARCRLGGDLFDVRSVSTGDPSRDLVVKTVMETNTGVERRFDSDLRYRKRQANCPAGWTVGDQASPGDRRVVNAVSGSIRMLAAPVAVPAS
jgi:hypothetical protein